MGRKSDESSTSSPSLVLLASYMAIMSGFCPVPSHKRLYPKQKLIKPLSMRTSNLDTLPGAKNNKITIITATHKLHANNHGVI